MPVLIALLSLLACDRPTPPPPQAPAPEKVAIPGTSLSFDQVAVPAVAGKIAPYKIGVREVTWAEFNAYFETKDMNTGVDAVTRPTRAIAYFGQVGIPAHFLDAKRPLTNVRWHSAVGYCDWLSKKTGGYYRLPTEAEWENAARAGDTAAAPASLDAVAWHKGNSESRTHDAGEKKGNALGLQDILGNVWEYCLEFDKGSEFAPVTRGGSWSTPAAEMTYASRHDIPLSWFEEDPNRPRSVWWLTTKDTSQGFRVVCVADPADQKDRAAAAAKIEVTAKFVKEKTIKTGTSQAFFAEVACEIKNAGDKELSEVQVVVHYLDPKGKAHMVDIAGSNKPGQATFTVAWPVLAGSAHEAPRAPLKPGESRKFTVDIPQTFDNDPDVDPEKFAGRATNVRFAK